MKTSLKNRPDFIHLTGEGVILETCLAKADEWFEDFEAELREILKQNYNYKDYWKTIIKEILGE